MNSNLFERKNFLDGTWMHSNITDYFSCDNSGNSSVIKVSLLRATANESDAFKKYLNKLPTKKVNNIVIDFSDCTFVDSTFLSVIIKFNKAVNSQVKLVVSDKRQLRIFQITKLDSLFKIFPNIDEALVS
jgi:anti-anti-sigma factor